jgi:hypothetical protein
MKITNQATAAKLSAYLHKRVSLSKLVDWAENAIMEGEFEGKDTHTLAQVVGRLGLADVREFGLTWEDCTALLKELGYAARVSVVEDYSVERRNDGNYAGTRRGAERAGFTGRTQESVIQKIQRSNPGAPIRVERVRNTDRGGRDKWRTP